MSNQISIEILTKDFQNSGWKDINIQYPKKTKSITAMRQWLEDYVGEIYNPVIDNISTAKCALISFGYHSTEQIVVIIQGQNIAMYFKLVWG